jgi:hypothetical protein
MEKIRLFLIISSPLFGLVGFLLFRHFNSGLGGSLYSKRWYFRFSIVSILLSIFTLVLYFLHPIAVYEKFNSHIIYRFKEIKWFEIVVSGIVGTFIAKIFGLAFSKKQN